MVFIIGSLIIVIYIYWFSNINNRNYINPQKAKISFMVILMAILFSMQWGLGFTIVTGCNTRTIEYQRTPIYSMDLKQEIKGMFIIGFGNVGTDSYYVYYQKNNNGDLELKKIDIDNVAIRMDDSVEPSFITEYERISFNVPDNFNIWFIGDFTRDDEVYQKYTKKVMVVPKGTIQQKFNIQ